MSRPTWLPNVGEWGTLPSSILSSSGVMETGSAFGTGEKVIDAWGGAIINLKGLYSGSTWLPGTFLVLWGGGHGDYDYNAYYAYGPLEENTPTWLRPRDSTVIPPINVAEDGSGNPVSNHTYHGMVWLPNDNRLMNCGIRYRFLDGGNNNNCHALNFNTLSPDTNNPWTNLAALSGDAQPSPCAAYDSKLDRVWAVRATGGSVQYYSVSSNQWFAATSKSPTFNAEAACCAVDTKRDLWMIGDAAGVVNFYRTNAGTTNDYYVPTMTGSAPSIVEGLVWDPVADAFIIWADNGKELWKLSPPTSLPFAGGNAWTWSSWTPAGGSTPSAANSNGTFNRFSLVNTSSIRGYILVNDATDSVYFYLAGFNDPAVDFNSSIIRPRAFAPGLGR